MDNTLKNGRTLKSGSAKSDAKNWMDLKQVVYKSFYRTFWNIGRDFQWTLSFGDGTISQSFLSLLYGPYYCNAIANIFSNSVKKHCSYRHCTHSLFAMIPTTLHNKLHEKAELYPHWLRFQLNQWEWREKQRSEKNDEECYSKNMAWEWYRCNDRYSEKW